MNLLKPQEAEVAWEIKPVRIDEILPGLPSEMAKLNKQYSVSLSFAELPQEEQATHLWAMKI